MQQPRQSSADADAIYRGHESGAENDCPKTRRHDRIVELCDCVIDIACALFGVSGREIRQPGRGTTDVARVRQIAMYVAHVTVGLKMSEVGRGFDRDRTTVMYACHLVEDMRDEAEFDRMVATTEKVAAAAFRMRGQQ